MPPWPGKSGARILHPRPALQQALRRGRPPSPRPRPAGPGATACPSGSREAGAPDGERAQDAARQPADQRLPPSCPARCAGASLCRPSARAREVGGGVRRHHDGEQEHDAPGAVRDRRHEAQRRDACLPARPGRRRPGACAPPRARHVRSRRRAEHERRSDQQRGERPERDEHGPFATTRWTIGRGQHEPRPPRRSGRSPRAASSASNSQAERGRDGHDRDTPRAAAPRTCRRASSGSATAAVARRRTSSEPPAAALSRGRGGCDPAVAALALLEVGDRLQQVRGAGSPARAPRSPRSRRRRSARAGSSRCAARRSCGSAGRDRAGRRCRGTTRAGRSSMRAGIASVREQVGVQPAHGVRDLGAAAVVERDVEEQPGGVRACGPCRAAARPARPAAARPSARSPGSGCCCAAGCRAPCAGSASGAP